MRAEVITVGSELLFGRTLDTHSSYISRECFQFEIEVLYHTSVGDHKERLIETISTASSRSDLIFLCGGLGPTEDDLTKEALACYLGVSLVQNEDTLRRLHEIFKDRSFPKNNIKQTYVFPSGGVFLNQYGTAPGLHVSKNGIIYILLPGPPGELVPMFKSYVRDYLKQLKTDQVIHTHILSFFGIGESYLEDQLQDLIASQSDVIIAPYAKEAEVTLGLTSKAATKDQAEKRILKTKEEILSRVGSYCYSLEEEKLEEVLIRRLRDSKKTVAVAESVTGGLFAHLLSTVSGSSNELKGGWISYTDQVKEHVVGVPNDILSEYGAVSVQTAECLAGKALEEFGSSFGISITGVAGPSTVENHPIGWVYIGLAEPNLPTRVYQFQFPGSRKHVQLLSAKYGMSIILNRLKKGEC